MATLSPAHALAVGTLPPPGLTGVDANAAVGEAKVVKADIGASNGVIHVVDAVIVPAR